MKILVTGSNGFIGKNMVNALSPHHEVLKNEWGMSFPKVKGLDWVIHLGAISSTTETNISRIYRQNIEFSIKLYEECIKHNVKFQFASSASVYGLKSDFKETSPVDPQNHYARSKALFEKYVEFRNADITTQIFRYFNVHGPHEEHKGNQASPFTKFMFQAKTTGKIKLFKGSSKYFRDFIHVGKVVMDQQRFFDVDESGIWNFGTGNPRSFYDVALEVSDKTGATIEFIDFPENLKGNYQEFTKADTTKLRQTLAL
jgi:ADP-L-glycero-D-manno-heptose 6-epimerase